MVLDYSSFSVALNFISSFLISKSMTAIFYAIIMPILKPHHLHSRDKVGRFHSTLQIFIQCLPQWGILNEIITHSWTHEMLTLAKTTELGWGKPSPLKMRKRRPRELGGWTFQLGSYWAAELKWSPVSPPKAVCTRCIQPLLVSSKAKIITLLHFFLFVQIMTSKQVSC